MFFPEGQIRVYLYGAPCDMRKSFDGLTHSQPKKGGEILGNEINGWNVQVVDCSGFTR
jgi:hypothetical protein